MKYYVSSTPGPMPPAPEQLDAAMSWLDAKVDDGTFDCIYTFMEGGGFCIVNAGSHHDVFELMLEYPLFGLVTWNVQPVLEFKEGLQELRAKLVEAQAAMGGH